MLFRSVAASIILGHITTSQKKKYQKENPLRRGSPAGGKGGKGGAKERRRSRLKEKVTSPFSPSLWGIESAAPMENPMGLPQVLGKPLRGLPHFQHPAAHPLFPLRLSPFLREKIFIREYPYRGLRLSIEFFSLYTCYYSLSDLVLQAHRTGLFYSDIPPMPRSCVCCCLCSVCSHSGRISRTLSSSGRRLSGKCSSK